MDARAYQEMYELEERHWWFRARRELVLQLLRREGVRGPVLDVGCGTGNLLRVLQAEYPDAHGLDNSPIALRYCAARNLTNLIRGDAEKTVFGSATFDAVTLLDVLEHIRDDRAALGEAHRILRPGGVLIVTVPAQPWLWSSHDSSLHHYRRYQRGELRDHLSESGYETKQLTYLYMTVFPIVASVRLWEHFIPKERSYMGPPAGAISSLLYSVCRAEAAWVCRGYNLPFGSSLLAVARRC